MESAVMIWRHLMLALPAMGSVPDHVLDRVGRLARGLDAELELFHCFHELPQVPSGQSASGASVPERTEEKRRDLERVADRLRDQGLEVSTSVHCDFPIYEGIVRQVLRHGPDLLVVPASRIGLAGPRILSYTDARLIEACPCPLLFVRTDEVYSEGPVIAALDPLHAHAKPAELDERIVASAQTLSQALAPAPVHLYHAVSPGGSSSSGGVTAAAGQAAREKANWAAREQAIRKIAHRHELSERCVYVELGDVESRLPEYAREMRASAVVMGAVSRSYPERALFGHTAEKVLDALECDVLIVKPEGFRSPVSRRPRRPGHRGALQPQTPSPKELPSPPAH
jgi:universal stress protein E